MPHKIISITGIVRNITNYTLRSRQWFYSYWSLLSSASFKQKGQMEMKTRIVIITEVWTAGLVYFDNLLFTTDAFIQCSNL